MVSTTSGTTAFNIDVDELIEAAFDPIGGEHISGEDMRKARRALNYILIELQNKNIPLSKLDTVAVTLTATDTYTLASNIVDVLEVTLKRTNGVETPLERYSARQYHKLTLKSEESTPTVYTVERNRDQITIRIWPIPTDLTQTLQLLVVKKIEDVTASYQKLDISYRYLPFITKWLSYELSLKRQNITEQVRNRLKSEYLESLALVEEEDRERVNMRVVPLGVSGV